LLFHSTFTHPLTVFFTAVGKLYQNCVYKYALQRLVILGTVPEVIAIIGLAIRCVFLKNDHAVHPALMINPLAPAVATVYAPTGIIYMMGKSLTSLGLYHVRC